MVISQETYYIIVDSVAFVLAFWYWFIVFKYINKKT